MAAVSNDTGMGPQMYAMKKATDVQGQAVLKVLESAADQSAQLQTKTGDITGIGKNLDIKA